MFLPEAMAKEWPQLTTRPFEGMTDYRQVGLAWVSSLVCAFLESTVCAVPQIALAAGVRRSHVADLHTLLNGLAS